MIYWVGMPIYIIWMLAYHSFDRDMKHTSAYFWGWFAFWLAYTLAMQSYSKNSLAGLTNYASIKIIEDINGPEPEEEIDEQ